MKLPHIIMYTHNHWLIWQMYSHMNVINLVFLSRLYALLPICLYVFSYLIISVALYFSLFSWELLPCCEQGLFHDSFDILMLVNSILCALFQNIYAIDEGHNSSWPPSLPRAINPRNFSYVAICRQLLLPSLKFNIAPWTMINESVNELQF